MCKKRSPLFLLLLFSGSCIQSRVDRSIQAPIQSQPPLPSLAPVTQSQTVEIHNDWNGYSDITPILRRYKLRVQNQELIGNAHIAVGGYGAAGIRQQATTRVKIPAAVTTKFLATLAKTPLKIGTYQPIVKRRDDYPSITIKVTTQQQQLTFSSQSQSVDRIPWKVTIRSTASKTTSEYITNSHLPNQALKLLSPYLDNPGIDRIIQRRSAKEK